MYKSIKHDVQQNIAIFKILRVSIGKTQTHWMGQPMGLKSLRVVQSIEHDVQQFSMF